MSEKPDPTPEGLLLAAAMRDKGLNSVDLAERTGITANWVRAIVNGYQSGRRGVYAPAIAKADTLAQMAGVLDITPAELRAAGRDDAAAILDRRFTPAITEERIRKLQDIAADPALDEAVRTQARNLLAMITTSQQVADNFIERHVQAS